MKLMDKITYFSCFGEKAIHDLMHSRGYANYNYSCLILMVEFILENRRKHAILNTGIASTKILKPTCKLFPKPAENKGN